jgi:hypothetical protein
MKPGICVFGAALWADDRFSLLAFMEIQIRTEAASSYPALGWGTTCGSATSRSLLRTLPIFCRLTGHSVSLSS